MRKRGRKLLAMTLAVSMSMNMMSFQAMADEGQDDSNSVMTDSTVSVEVQPGGGEDVVDVTITVTEKENGTTEIKTETPEGGDLTEDGLLVDFESTEIVETEPENNEDSLIKSDTTYTAENANGTYSVSGGSETTITQGDGSEGDIEMELIKDGEVQDDIIGSSNTADSKTTGELKEDNPAEYNQTTITTTDRTADVEVSEIVTSTGDVVYVGADGNPVGRTDSGFNYYWSDIYNVDGNSIYEPGNGSWKTGNSYHYIIDAEGNEREIKGEGVCQRVVACDNGTPGDYTDDYEIGGLYCVDAGTGIKEYLNYRKANLEDADYYTEEEAAHLRAILNHGYTWDDDTDDDSVLGNQNLDEIKKMLAEAAENGDEETKALLANIDFSKLTREQAATATGMAIWHYGNRVELKDGERLEIRNGNPLVDTLYKYLIGLDGETKEESEETEIINEEKFVDDMEIVIGSMVKEDANNQDNDDTNDVYNVDLKFSLVVEPSKDKDDLVVKVLDNNGNVVKTARIAGSQKEGENFGYAETTTDEEGNTYYVLKNLKLEENSNTTFNLKLEGAQLLTEGVYIFESQQLGLEDTAEQYMQYLDDNGVLEENLNRFDGDREKLKEDIQNWLKSTYGDTYGRSQNFIGKYSGMADVDVNMQIDMTFNVEEATVTTERVWRDETYTSNNGGNDTSGNDGNHEPVTSITIPETEVPLAAADTIEISDGAVPLSDGAVLNIEDAPIPLAVLPMTGDVSVIWMLLSMISGLGLAGVSFADWKKRK